MPVTIIYAEKYQSFRKNLDYLIEDTPELTKELLRKLMTQKGFRETSEYVLEDGQHRKIYKRLNVSEKQLELAWEYVQDKAEKIIDIQDILFRLEKYKRHDIKRAMKPVIYKGKKYRKGQFLPKVYK